MKRFVVIAALVAIVTAAVVLSKRCTVADEGERATSGAPTEREQPQARAS